MCGFFDVAFDGVVERLGAAPFDFFFVRFFAALDLESLGFDVFWADFFFFGALGFGAETVSEGFD